MSTLSTLSIMSTLSLPHACPSASLSQLTPKEQAPDHSSPEPLLSSQQLMQGHKTVGIVHNGIMYRLQATRLGKLILTK